MADIKMIKVENSEFEEKQIGNRYADVMLQALKSGGVQGLTVGQMAELSDMIKDVESKKEDSTIELTPANLKTIIEKTRAIKWVVFNQEIVDMDKYLTSL